MNGKLLAILLGAALGLLLACAVFFGFYNATYAWNIKASSEHHNAPQEVVEVKKDIVAPPEVPSRGGGFKCQGERKLRNDEKGHAYWACVVPLKDIPYTGVVDIFPLPLVVKVVLAATLALFGALAVVHLLERKKEW